MEVEIIDNNLIRIAGTGPVKGEVGWRLLRGLVNKYVLEKVAIDEPGYHEFCQNCPLARQCFYQGYIVYPINFRGIGKGGHFAGIRGMGLA